MKSRTFRKYLFVLLACMSLPMIAVFGIMYYIMQNEIIRQTKAAEQKLLSEYRYKYDTSIQSIRRISVQLLESFGNESDVYFLDRKLEDKWSLLTNLSVFQENEIVSSYYVYFVEEGRVIKNGSFYDAAYFYDKDFFDFEEIQERAACFAWKPNRPCFDDTGKNTTNVVTHLRSFPLGKKEPRGYIAVNIDFDKLINLFFITDARVYTIKDSNGQVIYSSEAEEFDENNYLTFTTESEIYDWSYSVHIEKQALLAPLEPVKKLILIIVAVSLFACLCISVITSQMFYQPIHNLLVSIKGEKRKYNENEFEIIKNKFIQNEQEKMQAVEKNRKIEPVYYENIIRNLLMYKTDDENSNGEDKLFIHSAKIYCVMVFCDYTGKTTNKNGIWTEIKSILVNMQDIKFKAVGTQINRNVAAVIAYSDSEDEEFAHDISREARCIQKALASEKEINVSAGVSKCVKEHSQLSSAYLKALGASYYHIYYGTDVVIEEGSVPAEKSDNVKYPARIEQNIISALKEREIIKMLSALHLFFTQMEEQFIHPNLVRQWVNNLRMAILSSVEILGIDLSEILEDDRSTMYQDIEVNNFSRLSDLEEMMSKCMKMIAEGLAESTDDKHKELVNTVKKYILEHISEDLSLAVIADHFKMSPPYLSTVFKQQTNQNFVKYMIGVKMEFAADLLVETRMNVSDIAEKTGYTNLNSFSNAFKKYYGVTPSQYRYNHTR